MKKLTCYSNFKRLTLIIGLVTVMRHANAAELDFFAEFPEQADFPVVVLQPSDQTAALGGSATFEVKAANGPLTYQWLQNGKAIPDATNSSLTLEKVSIDDVGAYSCNVAKDLEIVPTRKAQLMVYAPREISAKSGGQVSTLSLFGNYVLYSTPVIATGGGSGCPGPYAGYVIYTKTAAQGWGWTPSTGTTTHSATDLNRTDTKVEYSGKRGDRGCNQTTVSIPHPTVSTAYRFAIYFTNNVPTNAYPISLDGFNP